MRVQKVAPGNYVKILDKVDEKLLQRVMLEEKNRVESDYRLQAQNQYNADTLARVSVSLATLMDQIEALNQRVSDLEGQAPEQLDVYTKEEIQALLGGYLMEEIQHPYAKPSPTMFEESQGKLKCYRYFPWGRLRCWPDHTFGPARMRRYTIFVFCLQPHIVNLAVHHEDHFVIYLNNTEIAALSGNNISGTPDSITLQLELGWNTLAFLLANDSYDCSFDIGINLAQEVDAVAAPLLERETVLGQLAPASVKPSHLDPMGVYSFKGLYLTETEGPALEIGDGEAGRLKLGDTQFECDDGVVTIDGPLAVNGTVQHEGQPSVVSWNTGSAWAAEGFYMPPATLIDDPQAAGGKALYSLTGTSGTIGSAVIERLVPGSYQLKLRGKCDPASETLITVNIYAGDDIVVSRDFTAGDFDREAYAYVLLEFVHPGGECKVNIYATGAGDFRSDILVIAPN